MSLTRRFFLAAVLPVAFAAVRAYAAAPLSAAAIPNAAAVADRLRALVPAPESARLIGRAYLADCPEEGGDDAALAHLILADSDAPVSAFAEKRQRSFATDEPGTTACGARIGVRQGFSGKRFARARGDEGASSYEEKDKG